MKSYLAIAFVLTLVVLQVTSQGSQQPATKTQGTPQSAQVQALTNMMNRPQRNPMGGLGSLFPMLALTGGSSDKMSNLLMYRYLMNPQQGGGASGSMFGGGLNPLLFGNMFGLEMGFF